MNKYLQLDYSNSQLYEYSKEPKDGFTEYKSNTGNISYRKYYKTGVYGTLMNVSVRESNRGSKYIGVAIKSVDGDHLYLQIDLFNQRGTIDDRYAESLIRVLGNLKKGGEYRFFTYNLTADTQRASDEKDDNRPTKDKYYDVYGVSVKTANIEENKVIDKVEPALAYTGEGKNVIPKLKWVEDTLDSSKKKPTAVSVEAKDNFLKEALKSAIEGHLKYEDDSNNSSETAQEEKPKQDVNKNNSPADEDDKDDLPF